jgi:riboflavin synthase
MRKAKGRALVAAMVVAVLAVGCSNASDKSSGDNNTTTPTGNSNTPTTYQGTDFTINLIPHTATHTTMGSLSPGQQLNLEIDVLARYLKRLEESRA